MSQDRRPWTQEELNNLDRLLGKVSAATIAKRLKRTETSVVMEIKALGHSRRVSDGYTVRDLEECLGEDHHKIHKWIANGWLRERLQGTHRHDANGHDILQPLTPLRLSDLRSGYNVTRNAICD
jgi:hypothetical protein